MKIVLRLGRNLTIFVHLAYWCSKTNWDIRILISVGNRGNPFCTSCENLVRFGLVTPEFYAKEVVRPESIIVTMLISPVRCGVGLLGTQVISKCFSQVFARRRHYGAERAIR